MSDKIGIHWFRLDLRLNDNPSLQQLSKVVDLVLPIYIFDENIEIGQASMCWLEKSLLKLNDELFKLNIRAWLTLQCIAPEADRFLLRDRLEIRYEYELTAKLL